MHAKASFIIFFILLNQFVAARDVESYKDQTIKVTPNIANCSLENFELVNNNCPGDQACANKKLCTCSTSNKKIKWKSTNEVKLRLKFSGNPPFENNCGNTARHHYTCTVKSQPEKGQFDYVIYLETDDKKCDNPINPRIVIK